MRLVAVGIACVFLLCAAPARADERLQKLADGLKSAEQSERYAAYNALNRETSPALVGILLRTLPDCPDMGQYYGVLVLQRQPLEKVKPALRKLLGTSSVHLRVLAAAQLVRLGDRHAASVLVEVLQDTNLPPERMALMLTRLYSVRDARVQAAVRALLTKDGDPAVLEAALYNIYLVRDKASRDAVRGLHAHEDAGIRALAAGCLMVLGEADAATRLAAAIEAGGVTYAHIHKLRSFLTAVKPVPEPVLAAFLQQLEQETDANVLRALIDLLADLGYAKAVGAIRKLLDHESATVSKAAFGALTRFPGAVTPESMRELLESGSDARKLAAAEALRRADDDTGLPVALAILKEGASDSDRWEAARVLGGFRTSKVVEPLLHALLDDNTSVRANAYSSLGTVLRSLFPYRRIDLASTGYVTSGSEAARKAAVAKIRAWWSKHKDGDW